jgi:hypothetical protein
MTGWKSVSSLALVVTLAAAGVTVSAGPAAAGDRDPRNCTVSEYRAVKRGMSKTRVARILDGRGVQESAYTLGGHKYESRRYGRWSQKICIIDYKDAHVTDKARF